MEEKKSIRSQKAIRILLIATIISAVLVGALYGLLYHIEHSERTILDQERVLSSGEYMEMEIPSNGECVHYHLQSIDGEDFNILLVDASSWIVSDKGKNGQFYYYRDYSLFHATEASGWFKADRKYFLVISNPNQISMSVEIKIIVQLEGSCSPPGYPTTGTSETLWQ